MMVFFDGFNLIKWDVYRDHGFNLGLEKSQFIITMGMGFEQILSNDKHSQIAKLAKITSFDN